MESRRRLELFTLAFFLILVISRLPCCKLAKADLTLSDQQHFDKALQYYVENHLGKALREIDRAIDLNPKTSANFHLRGNIYYELRQYEKAKEDYNKAIRLNPKDASAYSNRGWSERHLGQIEEAVRDWNECNKLLH